MPEPHKPLHQRFIERPLKHRGDNSCNINIKKGLLTQFVFPENLVITQNQEIKVNARTCFLTMQNIKRDF